jgi:hypothetical protein
MQLMQIYLAMAEQARVTDAIQLARAKNSSMANAQAPLTALPDHLNGNEPEEFPDDMAAFAALDRPAVIDSSSLISMGFRCTAAWRCVGPVWPFTLGSWRSFIILSYPLC